MDSMDPYPDLQQCLYVQFATNLDYTGSLDHGVKSIGDDGAAHKGCKYRCCKFRL
jgi:hypothetical protein